MIHRTCCALAIIVVAATAVVAVGNDLSGRVVDTQGRPLPNATVMVNTAAPREGVAVFCPSCYLDCGRKTLTDVDGRFAIPDLDSTLVFYLVATAEGHRARVSEQIDPVKYTPDIVLDALPADLPPNRAVRGRVVDAKGEPVIGALVEPYGCRTGNRRWWGSLPGVDPLSVTNDKGEFVITARDPADAFDLEVRSPRHAPKRFGLRATGEKPHELSVDVGAIVHGRLLKDGKPMIGVSVGFVQTDRSSDEFLGEEQIGTDDDGQFKFTFVAPGHDYYIYTVMDSMKGAGSLPLQRVTVGDHGTISDLGDLKLSGSHTLSGRIVLADGAPLQTPIQLLMSREGAWDSQRVLVVGDGKFRFDNVPESEPVTFVARVPGYHLEQANNRFQLVRDSSIAMFVENSRNDIDLVFVQNK